MISVRRSGLPIFPIDKDALKLNCESADLIVREGASYFVFTDTFHKFGLYVFYLSFIREEYIVERTLAILKPDCVRKNLIGQVVQRITGAGFKIIGMRQVRLDTVTAGGFYEVHRARPFFNDLVIFMSSGPCVPMVLEKENAVNDFRTLIGATDPREAADGTLRKDFADSKGENIVHGSDSPENAAMEINYFFSGRELTSM